MSSKKLTFQKCRDLILGIVTLILGVCYTIYAQQIKTRPKITPSYSSARIFPSLASSFPRSSTCSSRSPSWHRRERETYFCLPSSP